jgi:hypothetical protein
MVITVATITGSSTSDIMKLLETLALYDEAKAANIPQIKAATKQMK